MAEGKTTTTTNPALGPALDGPAQPGLELAQFGAGCFWGVELTFQRVEGVVKTEVGYSQGRVPDPNYQLVCTGSTNHAEVVRVQFDPALCPYTNLLSVFWGRHDPTTPNRQVLLLRPGGHIKRDCPKYKAQDQSSDTAATAVMADVDESEVSTPSSIGRWKVRLACEGRIWMANNTSSRVVGRGSVRFRMADGRSVTLTEVRHVPNLRKNLISIGMLDAKGCRFDASGGILRVSKGNKEMLWGKKTRGLYRLEGSVQTGGATVRHGSSGISKENGQGKQPLHRGTQSKRRGTWRIRSGTRAQGDALGYVRKSGQTRVMQPVQDVHRKAQRKETKSILRSCTAKGAATPKRVSFALDLISGGVLSSCAHKGGEMEPRQLANPLMRLGISDAVLQSYGGAGSEVVRKDNLKTSDYPPGGDVGTQYRSGIYYYNEDQARLARESMEAKQKEMGNKKIVTEILPAKTFYGAEEYHQQYLEKGGGQGRKQSAAKGCNDPIRCYG
ncbi:peptide met sulfoxide reductase 4 [Actinidia rufa]|uniref:peptide-methionine (S)-S-oxide reductase n=1 Tax=Actinidia rufa TaxID=165716 RepID=A0A7J0GML4_9ERIC|nr:peptide met sulfoxide reductase 4 [Actinidia rufa]